MRALVCDRFGSLDDIRYRDIAAPVPGPGEVLVRVRAAAAVFTAGRLPMIAANRALLGVYSVIGVHWLTFVQRQPEVHAANMDELMRWVCAGALVPKVTETLPLSDGVAALRRIADRQVMGKVVLIP